MYFLFSVYSSVHSLGLKAFPLSNEHGITIWSYPFQASTVQTDGVKKRNSKYSSLQQMTPAGVFRRSFAAGELFCSLVIHCRTTLPEALVVLTGFHSWDLRVLSFFSVYPCNPDMDSVTAGIIKNWYCTANQEGMEMFGVVETESIKQF